MTFIFTVCVCTCVYIHSSYVYLANLHAIARIMYWTFSLFLDFALIHHQLCLCGLNSTDGWTVTFSFSFFFFSCLDLRHKGHH
jgi:hypothetical protein